MTSAGWLSGIQNPMVVPSADEIASVIVPRPSSGQSMVSSSYLDAMPMNWSWEYHARGDRPALVFHVKKYSGNRDWMIELIAYNPARRESLDPRFMELIRESYSGYPNQL